MTEANMILISALAILQAADIYTTKRILDNGGRELNPAMKIAMDKIGVMPAMLLAKILIIGAVAYANITWLTAIIVIAYSAVVTHNARQMKL